MNPSNDSLPDAGSSIEIFAFASVHKPKTAGTTFVVVLEIKKPDDKTLKKWYFLDFDSFLNKVWQNKWNKPKNRLRDGKQISALIKEHYSSVQPADLAQFQNVPVGKFD